MTEPLLNASHYTSNTEENKEIKKRNQSTIFKEFFKIFLKIRYKSFLNDIIMAFGIVAVCLSFFLFDTDRKREPPYQQQPITIDLNVNFSQDLFDKYHCKIVYYPDTTPMTSTIRSLAPYCTGNYTPRGFNNYQEYIKAFNSFDSSINWNFLGISYKPGNSEYDGLLYILGHDSEVIEYVVMAFYKYYFDEFHISDANLTLIKSEFFSDTLPNNMISNKLIYLILPGCALGLFLIIAMNQLNEFQDSKMMQLMLISGVREHLVWFTFFINDFALMFIWSLCTSMGLSMYYDNVVSFGLLFVESILATTSNMLFNYTLGEFIHKKGIFVIYGILILAIEALFPMMMAGFSDESPKFLIRLLHTLLPPCQLVFFYLNIFYSYALEIKATWSTLNVSCYVPTTELLLLSIAGLTLWFLLFALFLLMNSRPYGAPLIGWKNFFKLRYWKALFRRRVLYENDGESSFIKVNGMNKTYSGRIPVYALKDARFDINYGEAILLIGPNGCGKTTLLNGLTGFNKADSGELKIFGKEATNSFYDIQDYLGICFQENVFFPKMSVREHLRFFCLIRGTPKEEVDAAVVELVEHMGFGDCLDTKAKDLSGGQKRKLCIAMAIIGSPPLVVLDEPTAGIDVTTRQVIWKSLASFTGMTSLISTHSLEEAESVSSRIFVMRDGEILFQGSANELRMQNNCGYKITLIGEGRLEDLKEAIAGFIKDTTIDSSRNDCILVPVNDNMSTIAEFLDEHLQEYGFEGYTIIVEELEHVLSRMIAEDE